MSNKPNKKGETEYRKQANKINEEIFGELIDYLNTIIGGSNNHVMTQCELAELLGCQNSTISRWLNRQRRLTIEDTIKICEVLKLDKKYFLQRIFEQPILPLEEKYMSLSEENKAKVEEYITFLQFQDMIQDNTEREKTYQKQNA